MPPWGLTGCKAIPSLGSDAGSRSVTRISLGAAPGHRSPTARMKIQHFPGHRAPRAEEGGTTEGGREGGGKGGGKEEGRKEGKKGTPLKVEQGTK